MSTFQPLKRGAPLPYRLLAGVEPCRSGWLVVSGKLQGITMFPEPPQVMETLRDAIDSRPSFEFIALHCPIGLPSEWIGGGRGCDRDARRVLGPRRGAAVLSPPTRASVEDPTGPGLSAVGRSLLARIKEANVEVASFNQRVVFEVHPELGFYQLNGDSPLTFGKRTQVGIKERLTILEAKMPGLDRVLDNRPADVSLPRLLDACIDLWTARRIAARAIVRMPEVPEWDSEGVRMEIVR
jgi:predicted RNase H-like nuclease